MSTNSFLKNPRVQIFFEINSLSLTTSWLAALDIWVIETGSCELIILAVLLCLHGRCVLKLIEHSISRGNVTLGNKKWEILSSVN